LKVEAVVDEDVGEGGAGLGAELLGGFGLDGSSGAGLGQVGAVLDVDDGMQR